MLCVETIGKIRRRGLRDGESISGLARSLQLSRNWTYNNDRPNIPLMVCRQTIAGQRAIGGITPAQKPKMAALGLQVHPVRNGGITNPPKNTEKIQA